MGRKRSDIALDEAVEWEALTLHYAAEAEERRRLGLPFATFLDKAAECQAEAKAALMLALIREVCGQ